MSYDFHLFRPRPGIDPLVTAQTLLENDAGEPVDDALIMDWHTKSTVVAALLRKNPQLQVFPDELATFPFVAADEYPGEPPDYIELTDAHGNTGIQLTLFDESIGISVPYWHRGAKARATFGEIWGYLEIVQRSAGCLTYDPQLGQILNPATDFDKVIAVYEKVVTQFQGE